MKKLVAVAIAVAILSPMAVSGADHLDIKTGLWEVTVNSTIAGTAETNTTKSCLTKEKLDKPFSNLDKDCQISWKTRTSTAQDFTFECANRRKSTGKVHFVAVNSEKVAGTTELTSSDDVGHAVSVKMELQGKWVAAECGKNAE